MTGPTFITRTIQASVDALMDIFELTAPATVCFEVLGFNISQKDSMGEANEKMLTIAFMGATGSFTPGTGGSSIAGPYGYNERDNALVTGTQENTTEISGGTLIDHEIVNWNIRYPLIKWWMPDERIIIAPTDAFVVQLRTTPPVGWTNAAISISWRELPYIPV